MPDPQAQRFQAQLHAGNAMSDGLIAAEMTAGDSVFPAVPDYCLSLLDPGNAGENESPFQFHRVLNHHLPRA